MSAEAADYGNKTAQPDDGSHDANGTGIALGSAGHNCDIDLFPSHLMNQNSQHTQSAGMDPDSSVELIRRAQAGESDALSRLLERYLPELRRWAHGRS